MRMAVAEEVVVEEQEEEPMMKIIKKVPFSVVTAWEVAVVVVGGLAGA